MKKYYKTYTESHDGDPGDFYCEVEDGLIARQINKFKEIYYWATPEDHFDEQYDFTGHPEFDSSIGDSEIISEAEFSSLWNIAVNQKPQS